MSRKILFIVEGERDGAHASRIAEVMDIDAYVFPVCANIYMLYSKLKKDEFNINITDALLEMNGVNEDDKKMLKEQAPFTYTYLLFDMDPHHGSRSLLDNTTIIKEMLCHFVDETDNTIGKLYISYPMFEALWDYMIDNEEEYKKREISKQDLKNYKRIVGERGIALNLSKYSLDTYKMLGRMNVKKANYIVNSQWKKPSYEDYVANLNQNAILDAEEQILLNNGIIKALSSLPLFMVDYWGNEKGFYDSLFTDI